MGLFNHLFKNKTPQGDERMEEGCQTTPSDGGADPPASSQPDLTVFLHPKAYVPRGGAAPVHPGARPAGPAGPAGGRPAERKTSHPAPPVTGEIILTLGDVLSRIPTQMLKSGAHDAKRELRFKIGDLSSDIARGRAVVPLSRIAALCPDIFRKEVTAAEDMDVRLPLQKLVEQIGLMRSNPPAPLPEKVSRPTPSEAPLVSLPARVPLAMRTPAAPPRQTPQPKAELKPGTPGGLPPNASELKPRAASPPVAPPEISKALQENILKAQPTPLRRIPAESRHGIPPNRESASPDAKDGEALEKQAELAAAKSEKVVPFPSIAAKAEIGPPKSDEERAEQSAERALEEKLRQLLAQKTTGESALKPELTAPSHLVTALAEIALQQSLLKTFEAEEGHITPVNIAQPTNPEASKESVAKSQLLGLLRMRLGAGDEAAALIASGNRGVETGEVSEAPVEAARSSFLVETELKSMEIRAADIAKAPAVPEPFEVNVSGPVPGVEMPGRLIAPREAESQTPEIRAAEVFREKREGSAPPEPLEESVPKADAISAPRPEVAHAEFAPEEAKPHKSGASATEAFNAPLKDLVGPEPPIRVSEAPASATLPAEVPHTEIPKAAESKGAEMSAAEVFEDTPKTTSAAALLKGIVSNAESIVPAKAEIVTAELAPQETETKNLPASAVAFERTHEKPATPKPPEESGLKAEAIASLPVEMPHAETPPQQPDLKKPEASPAGVFEDLVKGSALPELSDASVSKPVDPSPVEIAQVEIAPQEQESKQPEPSAVAVHEQTLKESVDGDIPQSGPAAPLAMEPIHPNIAAHESAPGAPEASAPAASAPDAPDEWSKMAAIPGADEIELKDAPEPAVLAEAQTSKLSGEPEAPSIDEQAVASQKDESLAALLVSLAALTESSPEASEDSALEMDEENPTHEPDSIWLSLPAILKNCPKEIFAGKLPRMRGDPGIELPFALIEAQLASGVVEISSLRFIAALPPKYMQYFVVKEGVKVSIPMEEILRNLPEGERERYALSAKPLADAGVERMGAEAAQPEAEPPRIDPIVPASDAEEANAVVSAGEEAPSEAMAVTPHSIPPVLEPAGIEIGEMAQKPEHTAPEPEAPAAALAEPPAPDTSPEHSSALEDAAAAASPAEMSGAVAPSEAPVVAVDPHSEEKSAESAPAPAPEPEPIQRPLVLNIPAFRVFAPPPIHVSASIASTPANPVPLAWAGHVSTQPTRIDEPREGDDKALHSPTPLESSESKWEAVVKSPADLEASHAPGLAPLFEEGAPDVAATPEDSTPNADAQGQRLDPPPKSDDPAGHAPATEPSAPPVESVREADLVLAMLETQQPEEPQAAPKLSALPGEHTALIRPPMIRPVAVPPPRILAFTPVVGSQAAASLSEKSPMAEPSAPTVKERPPIPSAFAAAPEDAATAGSAAESQAEAKPSEMKPPASETPPAKRAPALPKRESVPSDAPAAAAASRKGASKIAGKSAGEKAPVPTPPKIALSVPKLPVLHFPPAPTAEAQIPAPDPIPAPPPLPLVRFDQDVLQTIFMTDEHLDLPAVCRHVAGLPGIQACVISRRDEIVRAGEMPGGFEYSELLALAPGVIQAAGRLPIGALKHFTLYAETHSVSFFERRAVRLCVVHRARSFIPGVREKLVTVADELSKS